MPILLEWLAENEPDAVALQETKVEDSKFPIDEIEEYGYSVAFHGQKSLNGVAIVSKRPVENVITGFGDPLFPEDCRLQCAALNGVAIINTYVPNGTSVGSDKFDYKLRWIERFGRWVSERFRPADPVVWMGDINIAPKPIDVYDFEKVKGGIGAHPKEIEALNRVYEWGWQDCFRRFEPGEGFFTFWDFFAGTLSRNKGWRIDHIYASPGLIERCTACEIDRAPRFEERPSDHTIVWANFDV